MDLTAERDYWKKAAMDNVNELIRVAKELEELRQSCRAHPPEPQVSEEELKRMAVAQYPDPEYKGGWHIDQVLNKRIGFIAGYRAAERAALAKREPGHG